VATENDELLDFGGSRQFGYKYDVGVGSISVRYRTDGSLAAEGTWYLFSARGSYDSSTAATSGSIGLGREFDLFGFRPSGFLGLGIDQKGVFFHGSASVTLPSDADGKFGARYQGKIDLDNPLEGQGWRESTIPIEAADSALLIGDLRAYQKSGWAGAAVTTATEFTKLQDAVLKGFERDIDDAVQPGLNVVDADDIARARNGQGWSGELDLSSEFTPFRPWSCCDSISIHQTSPRYCKEHSDTATQIALRNYDAPRFLDCFVGFASAQ
jgi:hypothetical protein